MARYTSVGCPKPLQFGGPIAKQTPVGADVISGISPGFLLRSAPWLEAIRFALHIWHRGRVGKDRIAILGWSPHACDYTKIIQHSGDIGAALEFLSFVI